MKLLSSITLTLLASTLAYSQTTMCFKEKHNSMTTIENTALDGGECNGTLNTKDMKANGWNVDDIKITTNNGKYNFIYIFKKNQTQSNFTQINSNASLTNKELENRIIKRLEEKKAQEIKEKKIEKELKAKTQGKELYVALCQSCHGEKGQTEAMNASRALNTLNYEEMQHSIDSYLNDSDFGNGRAFIMKPYAAKITYEELQNISGYIKSLNK